ncbi:MAG: flavin reductase family protein [Acetobacteraceae bacterium]|nr:flavin reductase family protein [Acetobacteraceae bacterium]
MSIHADRDIFVAAMRRAATGVSVVATAGPAGMLAVTVSAVASVSADPPMVLACINRRSPVCQAIRGNGVFTVNLLTAEQAAVADTFAGRRTGYAPFDFACADWHRIGSPGVPCLTDALCSFHCHLHDAHDAGSHSILIGRVSETISRDALPLIYAGQRYGAPYQIPSSMTEAQP